MRRILIAFLALLVVGCASVENRPKVIEQAYSFAPSPGQAGVYLIRDTRDAPSWELEVTLWQIPEEEGFGRNYPLKMKSFVRVDVPPGRYRLEAMPATMSMFDNAEATEAALEAGKVYYYRMAPASSFSGTVFFMDEVEPEQAKRTIKGEELTLMMR